ncbi:MAG: Ig-like domain-containing protein [Oscillospiraceae bacterium]
MGLIKKTICPKCGQEYSVLKAECPYCGTRQQKQSARTPQSSDAVRKGTSASARAEVNTKWQLIFGLCLIAAVIIAVIILITTTVSGGYVTATPTPSPSETVTPTPSPTPTPTPTPTVESISITYLGQTKTEFTMSSGNTIQLDASIYPLDVQGTIEWSSSKEDVLTVDKDGLVTAVGKGWASVVARCYGGAAECKVWVR